MTMPLLRGFVAAALALPLFAMAARAADAPSRFWNLTAHTIVDFRLAPKGTTTWGVNQCANDKDGAVDNDERLRLTGLSEGVYDAEMKDKDGRICHAKNLSIKPGGIFSLEEKDLVECDR